MKKIIKKKIGRVVSDRMDKSVVVLVENFKKHPIYGKKYLTSKKFIAHDDKNQFKVGDVVEIIEVTPKSKTKSWSAVKIHNNKA